LTTLAIHDDDLAQLKTQNDLASAWSSTIPTFPASRIHILPSIEHAIHRIENIESEFQGPVKVLVSGSLHLVGGIIEVAGISDVAL
jgi:folylpolyglutamate synthase